MSHYTLQFLCSIAAVNVLGPTMKLGDSRMLARLLLCYVVTISGVSRQFVLMLLGVLRDF